MNKEYCVRIRISAMAIRDGETAPLSEQEVSKHLESCTDCRLEIDKQRQATELLNGRSRQVFTHDVWPKIAAALEDTKGRPAQSANVAAFVVLCLFLLAYKVVEVLPSVTAGVGIRLIPVGVLVLFFALLKQNPFEVNPNLSLQGYKMTNDQLRNSDAVLGQKYAYATAALWLGVISCIHGLGIEKAILAIVFAWLALRSCPEPHLQDRRVWAKVGLALGAIQLVIVPMIVIWKFDVFREWIAALEQLQ